jgi:beta-lactamase class A
MIHGMNGTARLFASGLFVAALAAAPCAAAEGVPLDALTTELTRIAATSGGKLGVTAVHLESGRRVVVLGDEGFPMASTFKVPVAVKLLDRVDHGELQLDTMVELHASDLHPGSGTLLDLFNKPGVSLSVRNLLELMMLISDNSATDVCVRLAGGAPAVTAHLHKLGVAGIRVDRPTVELIGDWAGVAKWPAADDWSPQSLDQTFAAIDAETGKKAAAAFDADPRDTATPNGMAALLGKVVKGEALSPASTALLLDIMARCKTGEARLRGLLPAGTPVAHKTGTIGGTTNDVGIVTLPGNAGRVIVAAFVKASDKEVAVRERAIAEVARAVHDYFLFVR